MRDQSEGSETKDGRVEGPVFLRGMMSKRQWMVEQVSGETEQHRLSSPIL